MNQTTKETPKVTPKIKQIPKKQKKKYKLWEDDMDTHIIHYNNLEDRRNKNIYFSKNIYKSIVNLIEYKLYSSKWSYIHNYMDVNDVKQEVLILVINNLDKYNPLNGKSFSYFNTTVFRKLISINLREEKNSVLYHNDEEDSQDNLTYVVEEDNREDYDKFLNHCANHFINSRFISKKSINIYLDAIDVLRRIPRNSDSLDKKSIQFLIRENVGMSYNVYNNFINTIYKLYNEYSITHPK